ncbi:hypothetical protein QFC21_002273 [Naganishia friedmannii]|uniref:Uncharacterized protein n=1 Tax=Naganishia friedmannii TaxID=89922 RepID=A0ACC2VYV0_9TREE|nr:hypothetical protein QFC21_002273 [Naganishia friedmannii]
MDAAEDKVSYKKDISPQGPSRTVSTKRVANGTPPSISSQPATTTDPELLNLEALNFNADPNEMYIPASAPTDQYVSRCVDMLGDDSMLFVILRSASPQAVRKVIDVADGAKKARHRKGLDQEGRGLYQYVIESEESVEQNKNGGGFRGPRVIKLDDSPASKQETKYSPPRNITIYLSKIELPDLQPRSNPSNASASSVINGKSAAPSAWQPTLSAPDRLPSQAQASASASSPARLPARVASPSQSTATPTGRAQHQSGSGDIQSTDNSSNAKSTSRIGRLFRSKS